MGASWQKKARPRLECLDGMTAPIPRGNYIPAPRPCKEDQHTLKCRLKRHAWYVAHYDPRPPRESEDDPVLIEARTQAMRQAKREKWCARHTTTSLSPEQAAAVVLPGDEP